MADFVSRSKKPLYQEQKIVCLKATRSPLAFENKNKLIRANRDRRVSSRGEHLLGNLPLELVAEIQTSLRRLHKISRREEMHEFDREMFVDNHQISQLETSDWQIIFGRRGSGKTTLLNAFSDHISQKDDSVYSIFIDLRKCVPSASGVTAKRQSDFDLALGYFYEFIRRFATELLDEYTDSNRSRYLSPLQRLVRHFRGSHKHLDDLVLEICEIAEYQPMRAVMAEVEHQKADKTRQQDRETQEIQGTAGISSGVPHLTTKGILDTDIRRSTENVLSVNERFVFEAARRYQPLKRRLEELLSTIGAKRLYILVDEWADLNRVQDDKIQPIFAELLRKTFSGSKSISVKIASIKGATRMNIWNRQGGIGLELDADIFQACDLDQIYLSDEETNSFFRELLFKRMCKSNEKLYDFFSSANDGREKIETPENFFSFFFKNEEAFNDIVKGSGKIPRDFISLFCFCALEMSFEIRPEWRRGRILKAITEYSIQSKHEIVSGDDDKGKLFYRIVENAKKTNSRVFLFSRELSDEARALASDLYHSRLIHPVSPSIVPLGIRQQFDCFYVDYGYFLDANEYLSSSAKVNACPFDGDSQFEEISRYHIQVEDIVGETIRCNWGDCENLFRTNAQSYLKQGLCPSCFRPCDG